MFKLYFQNIRALCLSGIELLPRGDNGLMLAIAVLFVCLSVCHTYTHCVKTDTNTKSYRPTLYRLAPCINLERPLKVIPTFVQHIIGECSVSKKIRYQAFVITSLTYFKNPVTDTLSKKLKQSCR